MKKIPTIFLRNFSSQPANVMDLPEPEAQWVFDGDGVATQKFDGVCCMIRDGVLYRRHEMREGRSMPHDWEASDALDPVTGKQAGWVPVREGPEAQPGDKWMLIALVNTFENQERINGTYEFLGPKSQGNVEGYPTHILLPHDSAPGFLPEPPRTFDGLREFFSVRNDIEGIVWHHPDGRWAKIKAKDFGLKRIARVVPGSE